MTFFRNNQRGLLTGFALCVLAIGTFWPVFQHDFINFDDPDYVTNNQVVQKGLTWEGFRWAFTSAHASNWHPVTWLSHMLDVQLFGMQPGWHHMTSLLFHVANALLLFAVLLRMTGALWQSWFVATLFAIHPLRVESVAWVAERKDVLSTFFWMLTLWAYGRYVGSQSGNLRHFNDTKGPMNSDIKCRRNFCWMPIKRDSFFYYGLALVFFAFGLMSKPMLVTLPFVLLLMDWWPLGRINVKSRLVDANPGAATTIFPFSNFWRLLVEKGPFLVLSAASSMMTFWAQKTGGAVATLTLFPIEERLANALVAYVRYLGKAVWPSGLVILYPHPGRWPEELVLGAGLLLAGLTAAAIGLGQQRPYLAVGWFWYLGTLVPVIGLVQVGMQSIADRYTYVPLIGIFIIVAWGLTELLGNMRYRRHVLAAASTLVMLLCIVATRNQLAFWKDGETILGRTVRLTSENFIAHNYLANALALKQKFDKAIFHYQEALRINPNYADAYNNLGYTLALQGKTAQAIENYQKALQIKPDHLRAHNNLGLLLADLGRFDEAAVHFSALARFNPRDVDALYNLGNAYAAQGKHAEAAAHLAEVVRLNPNDADAREKLGLALAKQGKAAEAATQFSEVVRLCPSAGAHYNLALALVIQGNHEKAVEHYREAIKLNPDFATALNDLAWILATHPNAQLRNGPEAVRLAERACELTHCKEPAFLGTLDAAYAEAGRFADAVATAKQARALAMASGQNELAIQAEKRLKLYEAGQPFRQD